MLKAKLYLNASVYTGAPMYSECASTCQRIIGQYGRGANHGLAQTYKFLFCADNDQFARGGEQGEILMVVPYDRDRREHTAERHILLSVLMEAAW